MSAHTKQRSGVPADFFAVEAAGLRWLDVPGGAHVVEVLEVTEHSLTVTRVHPADPTVATAADFGRRLAHTHDAGAAAFGQPPAGWSGDGYIGEIPLSLRPAPGWGAFYAEQRIFPYARRAHDQGDLSEDGLRAVERVGARLANGDFDDDAGPARLHGDLWAGNVLFSAEGAVLIDPAAQGGHRLTDLAMLVSFGFAHLETTLAAYAESSGRLPDGWRALLGLHQLHPLLVHAVLFGGGYGHQATRIARRYA